MAEQYNNDDSKQKEITKGPKSGDENVKSAKSGGDVVLNDKSIVIDNALVLSICISHYEPENLHNLSGVKVDKITICDLFTTVYGYDVIQNPNESVKSSDFWALLTKARDQLKQGKYNAFILVLSGHGDTGSFYLSDGNSQHIRPIQEFFDGKQLRNFVNNPKLFVIDACRGIKDIQPVTKTRSINEITVPGFHPAQQFTVLYGNTLGYTTLDDPTKGGIVIQAINFAFQKSAEDSKKWDLDTITRSMRFEVMRLSGSKMIVERHETMMNPVFFSAKGSYDPLQDCTINIFSVKHNKYLTVDQNWVMVCNRSEAKEWESIESIPQANNVVAFKSWQGKYLTAGSVGIIEAQNDIGTALTKNEKFTVQKLENGLFTFVLLSDAKYLSIGEANGKIQFCAKLTEWGMFSVQVVKKK